MISHQLNRRLTTQDASFLYFERSNQPMHGVGVAVYEGHMTRSDVTETIASRLHVIPRFRQKVVPAPFAITHPTWEDDSEFDIGYHITEETLRPPGNERAMAKVIAQQLVPPLDRNRPLWKMVVVHGRGDGNTAVLSMFHHAMVDGVSGVDLMLVLHDLTPTPSAAPPSPPWEPAPMPDALTLMRDAVRDQLVGAAERWTDQAFHPAEAIARAQQAAKALLSTLPTMLQPAPRTLFNGPISDERDVAWAAFPFAEIRAVRGLLSGTINDLVLTIVAGAIGKYLRHHQVNTQSMELRAMCPVSMRASEGRGALGNQVSMMIAPLYVGILDPVERLTAEREAMDQLKQQDQAGSLFAMTRLGESAPAWVQAFAGKIEMPNTLLNTVSTNVPGPQIPLYMAGHKVLSSYGCGMLSANIGLFNAIISYNQVLTIGATVDPRQIPDVWFYADCLKESFAELREAADRAAATAGVAGVADAGWPKPKAASASRH
ncbi:MAG: wax ester/triacylglycerol synthase family O-acyltransferase [Candidatus Binatia bacterium]